MSKTFSHINAIKFYSVAFYIPTCPSELSNSCSINLSRFTGTLTQLPCSKSIGNPGVPHISLSEAINYLFSHGWLKDFSIPSLSISLHRKTTNPKYSRNLSVPTQRSSEEHRNTFYKNIILC